MNVFWQKLKEQDLLRPMNAKIGCKLMHDKIFQHGQFERASLWNKLYPIFETANFPDIFLIIKKSGLLCLVFHDFLVIFSIFLTFSRFPDFPDRLDTLYYLVWMGQTKNMKFRQLQKHLIQSSHKNNEIDAI